MRKWILIGSAVVALALIVAAALAWNINSLIARNKEFLIAQAEQALGRKLKVGEVEATFLSGIGVRLSDFAMSEDPGYGAEDFVRARDLQVNLKLWPLLQRQIEIKRLILHEPVIRLVRNPSGEYNFSTIGKSSDARERPGEKSRSRDSERSSAAPLIAWLDVSGGDLHYIDRADATDLRLRQVDLRVEDVDGSGPFKVRLAAAVYSDRQNFRLEGAVGPLRADGDWTQIPLDGELNVDALDLTRIKKAAPKLRNALSRELDLSGTFSARSLRFKGTFKDLALSGSIDGTRGTVRYGKGFFKPAGVPLGLTAEARYGGGRIQIRKSTLQLHTLDVAGAGEVHLGNAPVLALSVESRPSSLEGWDRLVPALERYQLKGAMALRATFQGTIRKGSAPQMQGTLTLSNASAQPPDFPRPIENLDTTIRFTGERADIREMALTLGRSRIQLAAAIERFSPLTFAYRLSTPEIFPADYTSALGEERKADVVRDLRSEGRLTAADGALRYQGKLSSTGGTLRNVGYKNLNAAIALADKVAQIESLRVDALSGQIHVRGEYAFKSPTAEFSVFSKVQGIDVKELYAALDAKAERDIQGRLSADMKLSGSGKSWEEIKPGLRGEGEAEIDEGVIYNFNIAESVLAGITGIPGLTNALSPSLRKKYPETFSAKDTEFKEIRSQFTIGAGRINLKNIRMAAAEFVVAGNGWIDFNRRVDSRAVLTFSQSLSRDLAQSAREIRYLLNRQGQLEMPFSVSGRMPNVKARPDSGYLGELVQRNFLKRGVEDLQNRFLGGSESREERESAPEQEEPRRRRSTEDRIRRGLENLFRR